MMHVSEESQWPKCPHCGHRRQTICPVCQVAGDWFPLGDDPVAAAPLEDPRAPHRPPEHTLPDPDANLLLLCTTCDEPFTPRFYRRCPSCGFDFGQGIELPQIDVEVEQLNRRALFVLVGLVFLSSAVLCYFAWVLSD